jgi:predicted DNA-binding mobile mystery protein A
MGKKTLQLQQLNNKMLRLASLKEEVVPSTGWIKAIRTTLGMSMQQLGKKLSVSKQAILDIEKREKSGSITIKSLKEIARALDMQLVYGFVSKHESLEQMIEKRAKELATEIVMRTNNTMTLEDQQNSKERIAQAIAQKTAEIKFEMPKYLWD